MTRIALVVHPESSPAKDLASRAKRWWEEHGCEVAEAREGDGSLAPGNEEFSFAISLGGDGTMLRTVQLMLSRNVPVLGVNLGHLGYLTQAEPNTIEPVFERLIGGDFAIEERTTLSAQVLCGRNASSYVVLNEVAVEKTTPGHTVRLGVSIADRPFLTYVADGLVVATPTGSTAYNLSLRGPILSPTLRAMVLTPISPHMLFDRSLVLAPEEDLRLQVLGTRPAELVIDGNVVNSLGTDDSITVRVAKETARIVDLGGVDFHDILRAKFNLSDR